MKKNSLRSRALRHFGKRSPRNQDPNTDSKDAATDISRLTIASAKNSPDSSSGPADQPIDVPSKVVERGSSDQLAVRRGDRDSSNVQPISEDGPRKPPERPSAEHSDVLGHTQTPCEEDLWGRAWAEIEKEDEKSKQLSLLKENLKTFEEQNLADCISDSIAEMLEAKEGMIEPTTGSRQSRIRNFIIQGTRFVQSTSPVVMGVAKLDLHGIAPIVLGGMYTATQMVQNITQNDTEERHHALDLTLDIAVTVAWWNTVNKIQISRNLNQKLENRYRDLRQRIIRLYKKIIFLLIAINSYLDQDTWRRVYATLIPKCDEWMKLKDKLIVLEGNCEECLKIINAESDSQSQNSKILRRISSHDIRESYDDLLRRTKVDKRYNSSCQWFIKSPEFQEWSAPGQSGVLWLNGTMGTGKTTAMARAVQEIEKSPSVELGMVTVSKFFFFKRAADTANATMDLQTCLRSLLRQVSWDKATGDVKEPIRQKFQGLEDSNFRDSSMTIRDCTDLLRELVSTQEAYIMIDGLDECEKEARNQLLISLGEIRAARGDKQPVLHIILSGRSDVNLSVFGKLGNVVSVEAQDERSRGDQELYIKSEIQHMRESPGTSIFRTSAEDYPAKLEAILEKRGRGLFRWIEIQIEKFSDEELFPTEDDIKTELKTLEQYILHPANPDNELNNEYRKLLFRSREASAPQRNRTRAMKLLKLLACSNGRLDFDDLAEAINADESKEKSRLTPEEVRSILLGFVTEIKPLEGRFAAYQQNRMKKNKDFHHLQNYKLPYVRLAHASVTEFIMTLPTDVEGCSGSKPHGEAATLCLSRIRTFKPASTGGSEDSSDLSLQTYFFQYSCFKWPDHCMKSTEDSDNSQSMFWPEVAKFCISDEYSIWQNFMERNSRHLATDVEPRALGFVIATYQLWPLLEFADVRGRINLLHQNLNKDDLIDLMLCKDMSQNALNALMKLHRGEQIGAERLWKSKEVRNISAVETLLTAGVVRLSTNLEIFKIIEAYPGFADGRTEVLENLLRKSLQDGADVYECDSRGNTLMHHAAQKQTLNIAKLLLDHAHHLERRRPGSIQRLLRFENMDGYNPKDFCLENVKMADELETELRLATDGNRREMYSFSLSPVRRQHEQMMKRLHLPQGATEATLRSRLSADVEEQICKEISQIVKGLVETTVENPRIYSDFQSLIYRRKPESRYRQLRWPEGESAGHSVSSSFEVFISCVKKQVALVDQATFPKKEVEELIAEFKMHKCMSVLEVYRLEELLRDLIFDIRRWFRTHLENCYDQMRLDLENEYAANGNESQSPTVPKACIFIFLVGFSVWYWSWTLKLI